jgi:hypothetical protein
MERKKMQNSDIKKNKKFYEKKFEESILFFVLKVILKFKK